MDVRRRTRGNSRRGLLLVLALLCVAAAPSDRRLVEAVRQRNLAAVNALLSTGVDVNVPQADGVTAIAWAAHWDDLDTAARLLRAGAAVDAANDYGVTPLALACLNRGAAMVDLLLEAGADPNAAQTNGETPLMTAARTGHAGVVRSLLAAGAAPDTNSTGAGQTALMWAAAEGHADVVRALLDSGADVRARSAGGFTALLFAARRGDLRSARLLVARSANVDAAAADRNSPFLTQESPDGVTPLLMAVAANHQPLARFLLDQGADPTIPDAITKRTALHVAAEDGRDEMVRLLLERGADPNAQLVANPPPARGAFGQPTGLVGATPLYLAARAGDPTIMSMLIAHGADLGLATADGITPLMAAAGPSRLPGGLSDEESLLAVTLAVELGADVNARNQRGQTALHLAAMRGTDAIVELLVHSGADIDAADARGGTPLSLVSSGRWATPSTAALLRRLGAADLPR